MHCIAQDMPLPPPSMLHHNEHLQNYVGAEPPVIMMVGDTPVIF